MKHVKTISDAPQIEQHKRARRTKPIFHRAGHIELHGMCGTATQCSCKLHTAHVKQSDHPAFSNTRQSHESIINNQIK